MLYSPVPVVSLVTLRVKGRAAQRLATGVATIKMRGEGCADAIGQYDDPPVATGQPIERASTWSVFCQETLANSRLGLNLYIQSLSYYYYYYYLLLNMLSVGCSFSRRHN